MTSVLVADDLRKTYAGGREALKGVSLEVAPGELVGLLGPNGAGKSRTYRLTARALRSTSGKIVNRAIATARGARNARAKRAVRVVAESVLGACGASAPSSAHPARRLRTC